MQTMIFAAGLGTRLKPLTDMMPKALVRVGGKPLLEHVITKLKDAGADRIVVNVHHFAYQIIDYLKDHDNFGLDIRISDESDMLLDTGGGIKNAASLFDDGAPILIHNVDILSNVNIREFYDSNIDNDATLLVSDRKTKRYLLFDDNMRLVGWTNIETGEVKSPYPDIKPSACRMYAFSGIHIFSPRLFPYMHEFPEKFGIMDFYLRICDKVNIRGYVKDDLHLMDVGKLDTLSIAEEFINKQI
jgi:NDP-sugar pyrophosphorylase family protein